MMGIAGYKTKGALKARVKAWKLHEAKLKIEGYELGEAFPPAPIFNPIETSMFGAEYKGDGQYTVVGPDPYKRDWFATVTVQDGLIVKVS